MCVCVSVCVSVCERDRGRGKERGRESLWLCLCLGNGVLVYLCGCVLGALQTSGVLKARQRVRSRMSWMSPVSPYRVSAAVTFNPFAVCQPNCSPLAQLLCQPPNAEQGERTAEVRRQREIEIRRAFRPVRWASGDKSITALSNQWCCQSPAHQALTASPGSSGSPT